MTVNAALQNRVAFLINNISPKNVDSKVNEMRELITQELWPWFANYMVVKRAAQVRMLQVWTLSCCALQEVWGQERCSKAFVSAVAWETKLHWALTCIKHAAGAAIAAVAPPSSWLLCGQFPILQQASCPPTGTQLPCGLC